MSVGANPLSALGLATERSCIPSSCGRICHAGTMGVHRPFCTWIIHISQRVVMSSALCELRLRVTRTVHFHRTRIHGLMSCFETLESVHRQKLNNHSCQSTFRTQNRRPTPTFGTHSYVTSLGEWYSHYCHCQGHTQNMRSVT